MGVRSQVTKVSYLPYSGVLGRARQSLRWLRRNSVFVASVVVILLLVCLAVLAPVITNYDPTTQNLDTRLLHPGFLPGGDRAHPLGSDHLGRDVWSRIAYGSRISLLVALAAVAGAGALGILLGLISGYFGGLMESSIMGLVDAQLALPFVLLAIAIVAVIGPGVLNTVIVLIIAGWVAYARVVRSVVLTVKEREFVLAARSVGASHLRIIFRHILPNAFGAIIVIVALQIAQMIIAEAALSFLGLGIQPPTPSWGNMVSDGRAYITSAWWVVTLPGIAITITALAINFVGDWLRENLDPRTRKRVRT
jgi:peptide/nickel transport system permease protein